MHIWNGIVKGLPIMYFYHSFEDFLSKYFYYQIRYCKNINFCKFVNLFFQILKLEHKSFPMMYHLSHLDIKHGILRGGGQIDPTSVSWCIPAGIGLNWFVYDPCRFLLFTLRSSIWVVFNNFILLDATYVEVRLVVITIKYFST